MKRRKLHVIWLWGLLFLMTACGDDDYYYPSVKLEFVTVEAGEDGRIQTLIPDKGEALPVAEDRTGSTIAANTSRRVMSNYETMEEGAKIYSMKCFRMEVRLLYILCNRSLCRCLSRKMIRCIKTV